MSASRGSRVTPTPAATSACAAVVSSASNATRGVEAGLAAHALGDLATSTCPGRRDPGVLGEVGQGEPAAPRKAVPGGQDRLVAVVEQVDELEVGGKQVRERGVVVDQRQVGVTGPQADARLLGLGLDHRQLDARVALVKRRHRARRQRGAPALEGDQPQATAAQARERGQVLLGALDPGEDRVGVAHEHPARLGQADAAGAPVDELCACLALERGHVLRDRRLGEAQRLGGGGERAARRDLAQDSHTADVEHQYSLSLGAEVLIWTDGRSLRF